jgi:hypothetical protein
MADDGEDINDSTDGFGHDLQSAHYNSSSDFLIYSMHEETAWKGPEDEERTQEDPRSPLINFHS